MKPKMTDEERRAKNAARAKAWREANPERAKAAIQKWLTDPENLERKRQKDRENHQMNKEIRNVTRKQWRLDNQEYSKEWHRQNYANNKEKFKDYRLKKNFGISLEEFNKMLEKQNGKCAICFSLSTKRGFHVDHDHNTGKVRQLLCSNCNTGLGNFKESIENLNAAIAYIQKHKEIN